MGTFHFNFRFILDTFYYCLFLLFIFQSVRMEVGVFKNTTEEGNLKNTEQNTEHKSLSIVAVWVFCYILRDLKNIVRSLKGLKNLGTFRFGYDLLLHILFCIAIVFKVRSDVIIMQIYKPRLHTYPSACKSVDRGLEVYCVSTQQLFYQYQEVFLACAVSKSIFGYSITSLHFYGICNSFGSTL